MHSISGERIHVWILAQQLSRAGVPVLSKVRVQCLVLTQQLSSRLDVQISIDQRPVPPLYSCLLYTSPSPRDRG
eukprot:468330-Rhodomonas_salina.1